MKKTFRILGMLLIAVFVAGSFSSCSKDDDEVEDPFTHDAKLVGTWEANYTEDGIQIKDTYVFKADGSYKETLVGSNGVDSLTYTYEGKWETDGYYLTTVVTKTNDEEEDYLPKTYVYEFNTNNIVTIGGLPFVKK